MKEQILNQNATPLEQINMEQALAWVKEAETATDEERARLQQLRLRRLVDYVRSHSPFFREFYKDLSENYKLTDLPVSDKRRLMPNFNDWVTDPAITARGIEEYLADRENIGRMFLEKYTVLTTSGTSGLPLTMVRDSCHNMIHGAMVRSRLFNNIDPDIINPKKYRTASIIATDSFSSSFTSFERARNARPEFAHNMLAISIMTPITEIVKRLNTYKPDFLTGYPSALALLALEKLKGNLNITPLAVACSAEQLTSEVFTMLREAFQCPVLNNYCSTEGGEAAMLCECGSLHVNDDWVILEPVDEENQPVAEGVISSSVLVTNLASYTQPIIRYRMEDRVRILKTSCRCNSKLPVMEIMGREGDNLCLCGSSIPSVIFQVMMYKVSGALQYQFVQTKEDLLELRVVLMEGINPFEFEARMKDEIAKLFEENGCPQANFIISSEPPRNNRRGGKLKTVCREW